MKHIWKVEVHFEETIGDEVAEDWCSYNVEAPEDITARKRAVKLAIKEYEDIKILYAETKHVLEFED